MAANSLWVQYKIANVAIKLIVVNTLIFIVVNILPRLFGFEQDVILEWFGLSNDFGKFLVRPWTIITHAFLHFNLWHLFWNMVILYVFSKYILNLFNDKKILTIYFLGALAGGLLYMTAYTVFPGLRAESAVFEGGYLALGASAAVTAIVLFIATYTPNSGFRLFIFNLKLWHIAAFFVLKDLIDLGTSNNAGGLIAHLGGAIFGYTYALQLAKGNDIGRWWERFMDTIASYFSKSTTRSTRKTSGKRAKMHTVHKKKGTIGANASRLSKTAQQQKIDAILDKISKSGYDSLSKAEKDFLFKAGKE